jgi:hypothetical protein
MTSRIQMRQCQRSLWHEAGRLMLGGAAKAAVFLDLEIPFSKFEKKYSPFAQSLASHLTRRIQTALSFDSTSF